MKRATFEAALSVAFAELSGADQSNQELWLALSAHSGSHFRYTANSLVYRSNTRCALLSKSKLHRWYCRCCSVALVPCTLEELRSRTTVKCDEAQPIPECRSKRKALMCAYCTRGLRTGRHRKCALTAAVHAPAVARRSCRRKRKRGRNHVLERVKPSVAIVKHALKQSLRGERGRRPRCDESKAQTTTTKSQQQYDEGQPAAKLLRQEYTQDKQRPNHADVPDRKPPLPQPKHPAPQPKVKPAQPPGPSQPKHKPSEPRSKTSAAQPQKPKQGQFMDTLAALGIK